MTYKEIINDIEINAIADKVILGERISVEEAVYLYKKASLPLLGFLANKIREEKNGNNVYFNRNIHIEPTNQCVYSCKFCSYYRKKGEKGWEFNHQEMIDQIKLMGNQITEVHIVGGVHPKWDAHYFGELFKKIKEVRPDVHIKAFTAVEMSYIAKVSKMTLEETFLYLQKHGLQSITGGGAEIFDEEIRRQICPAKDTAKEWIEVHETAHRLGFASNATILYGHIETIEHRIHHLNKLRELQDSTKGFNVFIPLKYKSANNEMSYCGEVSVIEDIKFYAMSRIFLDNFNHIKAYWPMIGKDIAQLLLSFGVDDFDGTINDTTKIYSRAGAEDTSPSISTDDMVLLIKNAGRKPVERDSIYNILKEY